MRLMMMGGKRQERVAEILIHAYSQCRQAGRHGCEQHEGSLGGKAKSEQMNPSHADGS